MNGQEQTFPDAPFIVAACGDADDMYLISDALGRRECRVMGFIDCDKAYHRIEQETPDLVIVDLGLPGGGGSTLVEKIRGDERFRDVPIAVIVSAPSDKAPLDGMIDAVLPRPLDERTLVAAVSRFTPSR